MIYRIFRSITRTTSYGFSVAFLSTIWVYPAAAYGFYIFYANLALDKAQLNFAITGLVLATIIALCIHFIHYGLFYRLGIRGFSSSIRMINDYFSSENFFSASFEIDRKSLASLYENVINLPRNNLMAASLYTLSVIVILIIGYYVFYDLGFIYYFYIVLGGGFTVLIHGYFVFNVTEYLVGPYKEHLEKLFFMYETNFKNRYLLSVRNKFFFAIVLVLLCMLILTFFILTSDKPLIQIFVFIALSVFSIGILMFLSINKLILSLKEINRATKELAAGGSGLYFPPFLDRELVTFSYHYNSAAMEIQGIRSDLQKKVDERTAELTNAYDRLNAMYRQLQEDMQLAKKIQKRVLTNSIGFFKGIKTNIQYYPMSEVGGDIYDIAEIQPRYIRFFLADAAGHGVQAALVTMIIKGEYEKVKQYKDPARLLRRLNNSFLDLYEVLGVFFSCVILDLDLDNRHMLYASAGHPDQILVRGSELIRISHTGKLVGIVRQASYQLVEMDIKEKDKIILFTDGLYEQIDEHEDVFGEENLRREVVSNSHLPIDDLMKRIIKRVDSFVGKDNKISLHDDVTTIGIEINSMPTVQKPDNNVPAAVDAD